MTDDRRDPPPLPWLSSYGRRDERTRRERIIEWSITGGVGAAFLLLTLGMLWLFVRYPFPVLGGLAVVWVVGFVLFTVINRRARLRDRMMYSGSLFDEIRRARHQRPR